MKFIDLFAGIGGIRLGIQSNDYECVFSSEFDLNAQKTYSINFNDIPHGDITKISEEEIPNHDILLGGFPCQAFSIAGYRKGFEDTRGTLFFEIARILEYHQPKAFLLENVKGLIGHDKGQTIKKMLEVLNEHLGYETYVKVLNSMTHSNIPQNRERVFIVGFNKNKIKQFDKFNFPEPIPLTKGISDLLSKERQLEKYYYDSKSKIYLQLEKANIQKNRIYQWRRQYVRENKSNVCPTLTANMGTGGHNVPIIRDSYGIRKLTPRECARFQGYPESFILPNISDSKLYQQIGNSVTVPLIRRIADNIKNILE